MRTVFWLLESADGCKQLIPALRDTADPYVWTVLAPTFKVGIQEMTIADSVTVKRRCYEYAGTILQDICHYKEVVEP